MGWTEYRPPLELGHSLSVDPDRKNIIKLELFQCLGPNSDEIQNSDTYSSIASWRGRGDGHRILEVLPDLAGGEVPDLDDAVHEARDQVLT